MNLAILNNLDRPPLSSESCEPFNSVTPPPSLNVLRPCLTPRKPAAGVEPSAQSAAGEAGQDGVALRSEAENGELVRALIGSTIFKEFAGAFTEATGLPLALVPVQYFQLPLKGARNEAPFCALMSRQNRTCGECLNAQALAAQATGESPCTTVCYAGLCETAVPVKLGKRLIGFLRTGQVFQRKPSERQFQRVLKLLGSWGTKLDEDVLRTAFFETRVVSREQHASMVKLLTIFAEYLAILSNQTLIQRQNAELPMVARVKGFIREHYAEDLSLSQVAKVANTSPFYFCKLFKRATGLTFTKFLSRVRIEKSRSLLSNPQIRVSEVAYEVGFQSLTHFNRVFQKILGQSPTEWRLSMQKGD